MKLFSNLATSALFLSSTLVAASSLTGRSYTDDCAGLDVDLFIFPFTFGQLDVCLCVNDIPAFIQSNPTCLGALEQFTEEVVYDAVKGLIDLDPFHTTCTYPDNALPTCGAGCAYGCSPGFKKCGDGSCKQACPSNVPHVRRDISYHSKMGTNKNCKKGSMACGILGGTKEDWECVDVVSDLESCGGCFKSLDNSPPTGKDCTAIPGIADVSCTRGSCAVQACMEGYVISIDKSSCVKKSASSTGQHVVDALKLAVEAVNPLWK